MVPSDETLREQHHIEVKGPRSFWVHRFSGNPQTLASKFSRIVFFARDQQQAERYIRSAEIADNPK